MYVYVCGIGKRDLKGALRERLRRHRNCFEAYDLPARANFLYILISIRCMGPWASKLYKVLNPQPPRSCI